MRVGELIKVLQALPSDHEIAVMNSAAFARPPVIERVEQDAWRGNGGFRHGGFEDSSRAYLIRPAKEII